MRFDLRCSGCGKVLRIVRQHDKTTAEAMLARLEERARADSLTMRCSCGRVSTAAADKVCPRRGRCHEAVVVLRGRGDAVAGTGRACELRGLHRAHLSRGGRFDPPTKAPPRRVDAPGTVLVVVGDATVRVPSGQVLEVGGLLVDTRGPMPRIVPAVASDPPAKIPPSQRTP